MPLCTWDHQEQPCQCQGLVAAAMVQIVRLDGGDRRKPLGFLLLLFMGLGLGGPATKHNRHSSFVPRPATACWDTMKQVLVRAHLLRSLLHLAFGSFDPYKCLCLQMDDFAAITKVDGN